MIPEFVKSLQAEEARLEAELKLSPLYRQLEAVRESLHQLMSAYAADATQQVGTLPVTLRVPAPVGGASEVGQPVVRGQLRPDSMSSIVSQVAYDHFRETGKRAKSSQILMFLETRGIKIRNKKPTAQIASILSHNALFDNAGDGHGSGYGLREWSNLISGDPARRPGVVPSRAEPLGEGEATDPGEGSVA